MDQDFWFLFPQLTYHHRPERHSTQPRMVETSRVTEPSKEEPSGVSDAVGNRSLTLGTLWITIKTSLVTFIRVSQTWLSEELGYFPGDSRDTWLQIFQRKIPPKLDWNLPDITVRLPVISSAGSLTIYGTSLKDVKSRSKHLTFAGAFQLLAQLNIHFRKKRVAKFILLEENSAMFTRAGGVHVQEACAHTHARAHASTKAHGACTYARTCSLFYYRHTDFFISCTFGSIFQW